MAVGESGVDSTDPGGAAVRGWGRKEGADEPLSDAGAAATEEADAIQAKYNKNERIEPIERDRGEKGTVVEVFLHTGMQMSGPPIGEKQGHVRVRRSKSGPAQ